MHSVRVLARWDARAVLRERWFVSVALAFGLLTLAAAAVALSGADIAGVSSFDRTAATLVHLAMLFIPLLGLTVGASWLAGDRESGALTMLLSQPVDRPSVFAGKYLGLAWMMIAATLAGFGAAGVVLAARVGADRLPAFLWLIALSVLLALAMLSVGFAISATAPNRSRALGAALFAWLLFVILSDLGILGSAVVLRLPLPVVLALGVLNPVSAFRVSAIIAVSGSADLTGPVGIYAADRLGPIGFMLILAGILIIWAVGAYLGGLLRFAQQPE